MSTFYTCAAALFAWSSVVQFLPPSLHDSLIVVGLNSLSTVGAYLFVVLTAVYLINILRCRLALRKLQTLNDGQPLKPPPIPYTVPWIGNALDFLAPKPHQFWLSLFDWYPRAAGVCSILLGGRITTVLFDPVAIQYILQDRKLGKEEFNIDVMHNGLAVPKEECEEMYGIGLTLKPGEITSLHEQEKMYLDYLVKADRVNELTASFMNIFTDRVADDFTDSNVEHEIELYNWLRTLMFDSSTITVFGSKLPELSPDLEDLYFHFDSCFLTMFFGLPNWMISKAISSRRKIVARFAQWQKVIRTAQGTKVEDPHSIAWEPLYGSRLNRARQLLYERRGYSIKTRCALDVGLLFATASNAIPASNWMLMRILDTNRPEKKVRGEKSLYEFVMEEIRASRNSNGTFNIPILINQPALLSTFYEVLRVYVDTFVARTIPQDVILPYGGQSRAAHGDHHGQKSKSIILSRGSFLMIPSYPAHTHPEIWQDVYPHHPPPDQFYPYRFLTSSPHDTNIKPEFTTAHTTGAFFPYGGGKSLCPGRNFAKQEIMGALAIALTIFEFQFVSYVDANGRRTADFPKLRDTFPGSTVMVPSGDMRLKVRRRKSAI